MGRYVLVTNIWGEEPPKFVPWKEKSWQRKNRFIFESEKLEFDTIEEAKEYINLFESICSEYERPEKEPKKPYSNSERKYIFDSPNKKLWGWLLGDRETRNLVWGHDKLYKYSNKTNKLELFDFLFRGPDEIPKDYKWDIGEYDGWLQFRWGDGKNAIGYVEPENEKKIKNNEEELYEIIDDDLYIDINDREYENIENNFLKEEDKEKLRLLADRW